MLSCKCNYKLTNCITLTAVNAVNYVHIGCNKVIQETGESVKFH